MNHFHIFGRFARLLCLISRKLINMSVMYLESTFLLYVILYMWVISHLKGEYKYFYQQAKRQSRGSGYKRVIKCTTKCFVLSLYNVCEYTCSNTDTM